MLHVKKFIAPYTIPTYSIQIDTELAYFIAVYEWHLPDNHEIYKLFKHNLRNVNFIDIVNKVGMYNICQGLDNRDDRITNLELHSITMMTFLINISKQVNHLKVKHFIEHFNNNKH